ncbi:MAG TPA: outer membrane protein transport protein [Candidatus Polarisedimenticolaceae bacterium]|nr:outer membrane protein transport protein [Candidatus Polarisedimenticolaceae bacterium]
MRSRSRRLAVLLALAAHGTAGATNGFNLIGFGAESTAMGGADLAVARDTSALNTNPAGLLQIEGRRWDVAFALGYPRDVRHVDGLGNDAENVSDPVPVLQGGWARRVGSGAALGVGLFVQGGAGSDFEQMLTGFGNRDGLSSSFGLVKLSLGGAIRAGAKVALGASVSLTRGALEQTVFPDTSAPVFLGYELDEADGYRFGWKVGIAVEATPRVRLGAAYTEAIPLDLEGDRIVFDMEALGLGKVAYGEAHAEGLGFPREVGLGLAFRPTPSLLLSVEADWLQWSNAVRVSILSASAPDRPGAPPELSFVQDQSWKDQRVLAAGAAWEHGATTWRAGYNHGPNPIPPETLTPLFAAINVHHLTLGVGRRFSDTWRWDAAFEHPFRHEVTYTNPSLPFGPDAREEVEGLVFHGSVARAW